MERYAAQPRADWEKTVESQGLTFYLTDGRPYWDESVYYVFTAAQIDALEEATEELNRMCLAAVEHVVANDLFDSFDIPPQFIDYIKRSWKAGDPTIYGRFDLAYDGTTPKLLEYNADTPTGLIEAAVIQWFWLQDMAAGNEELDQFNSIHERLIEAWQSVKRGVPGTLYFTSLPDGYEDFMTTSYLRDTAMQGGLKTDYIAIEEIGWNQKQRQFRDLGEKEITRIFKLYPWEWLVREKFGAHLLQSTTRWLEPPWKMILSNKAILVVLHQMFPDSPYLLPAAFTPLGSSYVKKPILAREGANASIVIDGQVQMETAGPYSGPYVYQEYAPLPDFEGGFPVIGSWMINGHACGIGIREDSMRITTNKSRFVPHLFRR